MTPPFRLLVSWSVCHNFLKGRKVTLPNSIVIGNPETNLPYVFCNSFERNLKCSKIVLDVKQVTSPIMGTDQSSCVHGGGHLYRAQFSSLNKVWLLLHRTDTLQFCFLPLRQIQCPFSNNRELTLYDLSVQSVLRPDNFNFSRKGFFNLCQTSSEDR